MTLTEGSLKQRTTDHNENTLDPEMGPTVELHRPKGVTIALL